MTYDPSHSDPSKNNNIESPESAMRDALNTSFDLDNTNHSAPSYLAAYGLAEAPFSQQHNDRFLFLNSALNEQLELLKLYTQYGNLLLIVTGEHGIGKSSLKQRFIKTAAEEWKVCEIQADTMMDASILLRQIATGFGITEPPHDPAMLFEVLSTQLEHLHNESYEPILIIDDAHELPQEALQSLLYLAEHRSEQESALRIILFCEPVISTMLEAPAFRALKDKITHNIKLFALDEIQTAEYLRHRLAVAGFDGTSPFTPALIHKIHTYAEGIPAKINEAAHQNLLDDIEPDIDGVLNIETETASSATFLTRRNIIFGVIAVVVITTVLIFQNKINALFEETAPAEEKVIAEPGNKPSQSNPALTNAVTDNKAIDENLQPGKETTIEFKLNDDQKNQTENSPELEQAPPLIEENVPPPKITESKPEPAKATPELKAVNPNPVPASGQRQIISVMGRGFNKRQQVKLRWTSNGQAKEKILSANQVNVTSDSYMNLIINVGTQPDTWTVTLIDPLLKTQSNSINFNVAGTSTPTKETTTTKNNTAPTREGGINGQDWIRKQNKNHFTLQLLATHTQKTAKSYLKKFSLKEEAAIFTTQRKGEDWFTLLYGSYPSKSAAQAAASKLPAGVDKPWIRSFSSVLPSLKQANQTQQAIKPATSNIPENAASWLWSQNPQHYTLQLLASGSQQAIASYIQRYKLKGKTARFQRVRDGKDWYILLYGSFTGYNQAKQAIAQLPLAIQKSKPWPRQFSAIHAELN